MTQLRTEGWIHNVARHAVACFLTRGDLWVSWEEGMKVSWLLLIFYFSLPVVLNEAHEILTFTIPLEKKKKIYRQKSLMFSGVWWTIAGCRLVSQCRFMDVVVLLILLPAVLPLLLPCSVWQEGRSQWWLYSVSLCGLDSGFVNFVLMWI